MSGTLTLQVVGAKLTRDTEAIGKMDPYTVLAYRGEKYKTKVLNGKGKTPVWNQDFTFVVQDVRDDIKVKVFDEDTFGSDEVGGCEVAIGEIISAGPSGAEIDIFYKTKPAGKIHLRAKDWMPSHQML